MSGIIICDDYLEKQHNFSLYYVVADLQVRGPGRYCLTLVFAAKNLKLSDFEGLTGIMPAHNHLLSLADCFKILCHNYVPLGEFVLRKTFGQRVCKPSSNFPSTTPLQGLFVICETCLFECRQSSSRLLDLG